MNERRVGVIYAVLAYLAWGFVPLYWQPVRAVPALEILSHRIVWSVVFLAIVVSARRRWPEIAAAVRDRSVLLRLCVSTALIATNWFVYIWSVTHGHVIEASLGYFITPLVNVLLGLLLLGERMSRAHWISVALAASGVLVLIVGYGKAPTVALVLAATFGSYGFVRKTARVDSLVGLLLETMLLAPFAALFLGSERSAVTTVQAAVLLGGGIVTAVPLLWFAHAVRRLPLTVLGFFQYLSPTVQFLLGVLWFKEPLTQVQVVAFALIWLALAVLSFRRGDARSDPRSPSPSASD